MWIRVIIAFVFVDVLLITDEVHLYAGAEVDVVCDTGWTAHQSYCYRHFCPTVALLLASLYPISQASAVAYCGGMGARIFSIHSQEEEDFVEALW